MKIPKVDVHRHYGGSCSVDFVWDVITKHNLKYLAETREDVVQAMTFDPYEKRSFSRFMDKFRLLDALPWSESLIDLSIQQICHDLITENISFCWLDFSINKYMCIGWHRYEAIEFIRNSFNIHAPYRVGLVLSLRYESARAGQKQLAKLIDMPRVADCVIGLDLVSDEAEFDPNFYAPIMKSWRSAGKICRAHVGESQSGINVLYAINMGCNHIAHGFKAWEYPEIIELALDKNICFDLALTSNELAGCWTNKSWHPIRAMVDAGLMCTIGTDDPVTCSTNDKLLTLDNEYQRLRDLGFSQDEIDKITLTAVKRTAALGIPQFSEFL